MREIEREGGERDSERGGKRGEIGAESTCVREREREREREE